MIETKHIGILTFIKMCDKLFEVNKNYKTKLK